MKILFVLCIVLAVSCSAFGAPQENQALVVHSRHDVMERSVKIIQDLVANLQKAAEQALESVGQFTSGLVLEAQLLRDKILKDIENFKDRIGVAIQRVYDKFLNTSSSIKDCADSHRNQASVIFDETVSDTMTCVDKSIAEISQEIQELKTLADTAYTDATAALDNLKKCSETNNNLLSTGSCLGATAAQIEMKSVTFLARSTMAMTHINFAIVTMPVTLDMCAGSRLIQAGVQTSKVVLEISSCSATAIFNNLSGAA